MTTSLAKRFSMIAAVGMVLSFAPTYTLDKKATTKAVGKIAGGSLLTLATVYALYKSGLKNVGATLIESVNPFSDEEISLHTRIINLNSMIPLFTGAYLLYSGISDVLNK